jgi:GNAT superfamily N-acetyltransferase
MLELTGWESYPVDEHGELMTGRSPEERAAAPFRKYSDEWIEYRVALEMLDQTILEGQGTLHADYDWTWLVEGLEKLAAGEENELRFEPMEPDFRLRIEPVRELWEPVEEEPPAPEGPQDGDLFEVYAEIDLEQAARRHGYGGEGPAAHLVLERAELRCLLEGLQAERAALGQPPEGLVPASS